MSSYCFNCGKNKKQFDVTCESCGVKPQNTNDIASSMLLCSDFSWETQGLPYDDSFSSKIAKEIAGGSKYDFPQKDIEHANKLREISNSKLDITYSVLWFIVPLSLAVYFLFFI